VTADSPAAVIATDIVLDADGAWAGGTVVLS
jgi:hypothetical protein